VPSEHRSQMSSFAQFPVLDYGMEECSIMISIPARNMTSTLVLSDMPTPSSIDIYLFPKVIKRVNFKTLTWATKPKETERVHLDSLRVAYGEIHESKKFQCLSLSYQTFEFSCADCHIDMLVVDKREEGKCRLSPHHD